MKKTLIIALCSLALAFVACKKPVEPTPEPVDYAENYVGDYLGQFMFTITSMNSQPMSNMTFPIENIGMLIANGAEQCNLGRSQGLVPKANLGCGDHAFVAVSFFIPEEKEA